MSQPIRTEQKRHLNAHTLTIDKRERVLATGVSDVISFDEESVIAETQLGVIIIRGINLHVNKINLESGELSVSGEVDGVTYENAGAQAKSKGFFGRMFK